MPFPRFVDPFGDPVEWTCKAGLPIYLWVYLFGAMEELADPNNHQGGGTYSKEETATVFLEVIDFLRDQMEISYFPSEP